MLVCSDIKFQEICVKYFSLEYYTYNEYVNSISQKNSRDIDMDFDEKLNKYPRFPIISEISDKLIEMGWIVYIEEGCNTVIYSLIDKKLISHENETNRPILDNIHQWLKNVVLRWLERILQRENGPSH